jgi:hypothetical protein
MALGPATVATSIAALSVSGVTIKDLNAIPQQVQARDCPIFFPDPTRPMGDYVLEVNSYGSSVAKKTAHYTLNYVFLFAEVGQARGIYDIVQPLVQSLSLVLDALNTNDALNGCIDSFPGGLQVGQMTDPAGRSFFGATVPIRIMEFVN